MTIIDDSTIQNIVSQLHSSNTSKIHTRVLHWHTDESISQDETTLITKISRLIIDYEAQNNNDEDAFIEKQRKILIIKTPSSKSPLYQIFSAQGSYKREEIFYTKILPRLYSFDDTEYFTPKYFHSDEHYSLILEDLTQSGYKCIKRSRQLDFEHASMALKSIAKMHALSVKLRHQSDIASLPQIFNKSPLATESTGDDTVWKNIFIVARAAFIDSLCEQTKQKYSEQVTAFENISWDTIQDQLMPQTEQQFVFNVLNHGDLAAHNVMFKYDKDESVIQSKLIDFQLVYWSSLTIDLIQFCVTSVQFEVYVKYYHQLLQIYLNTLNETLNRLQCQPIYNMETLLREMDSKYALICKYLCIITPMIISSQLENELDDTLTVAAEIGSQVQSSADPFAGIRKKQTYLDFVTKWFTHFAQKGIFKAETSAKHSE